MKLNQIHNTDCISWLEKHRDEKIADLVFADPPFNIGFKYDVYEDELAYDEYYQWTKDWMSAATGVLKDNGAFWIAIGDEYAAEVRMIGRDLGLTLRNWVIWHYSFGQQTKAKFARSHVHLFYFVKDPKNFTFNDMAIRSFSDRQRVYKDKRASATGRIPDDTWNEFPRLCGTFGEREGWHPCQMPETILMRIILSCSNPGDIVLDPFAGSGTTPAAAKKLSRNYIGLEFSKQYAGNIRKRLSAISSIADEAKSKELWPPMHTDQLCHVFMAAAVSTQMLCNNSVLMDGLVSQLNWRLEQCDSPRRYTALQLWQKLEELRRSAKLPKVRVHAEEPSSKRDIQPEFN